MEEYSVAAQVVVVGGLGLWWWRGGGGVGKSGVPVVRGEGCGGGGDPPTRGSGGVRWGGSGADPNHQQSCRWRKGAMWRSILSSLLLVGGVCRSGEESPWTAMPCHGSGLGDGGGLSCPTASMAFPGAGTWCHPLPPCIAGVEAECDGPVRGCPQQRAAQRLPPPVQDALGAHRQAPEGGGGQCLVQPGDRGVEPRAWEPGTRPPAQPTARAGPPVSPL